MTVDGQKNDKGKLRMDLLPPEAIEALSRVLTYGATKYEPRNWEGGMAWGRVSAATLRHIFAWMRGEELDPESGLPHLDLALCCLAFLVTYQKRGIGEDDRAGR